MKKVSRQDIIRQLQTEGLTFSDLVLTSVGDYAADDSDWNYKDIPHLHIVHELAESYPAIIGDDVICSVNMQKIMGLWFPVALVNYEFAKYQQVYFTTLFFFVIVIETRSDEFEPLKTCVTTTYSIGSPGWLVWAVPIIKWLLRRNYANLMSTDLPMRERRGELRKLGYGMFKPGNTYSFIDTLNITRSNVLPPEGKNKTVSCDYVSLLENTNEALIGDTGLLGVRLLRKDNEVTILPRSCPHEGACVEKMDFSSGAVRCPWHGRRLLPIGKFQWKTDADIRSSEYSATVKGSILSVTYVGQSATDATNQVAPE